MATTGQRQERHGVPRGAGGRTTTADSWVVSEAKIMEIGGKSLENLEMIRDDGMIFVDV